MKESVLIGQFRAINERLNQLAEMEAVHNDGLHLIGATLIALQKVLINKGAVTNDEIVDAMKEQVTDYKESSKEEIVEDENKKDS